MRLSGQATTAVGNVVVNMIVHNRFFYGKPRMKLRLFLGDDSIFLSNHKIDTKSLRKDIAVFYNMQSKAV